MMDDELLRRLDADEEVKSSGRSAVLRRAAAEYLRRSRAARISAAYAAGYGGESGLGKDFEGWENEGVWPAT